MNVEQNKSPFKERFYALHDYDSELKKYGAFEIRPDEQIKYNKLGYGIYWTLNEYNGNRVAKNITKINYWICDIDDGTKEQQIKNIKELLLKPTMIIETKRGYQCYWKAKNASITNYKKIEKRIIKALNGDKNCTDPVRLMRVPYYYHQKDKNNPFYIDCVEENNKEYTEEKMLYCFEPLEEENKPIKKYEISNSEYTNPDNWERIFKISNIVKGSRNSYLFWIINRLKDNNCSETDIQHIIRGINSKILDPLEDSEIRALLRN